MQYNSRFVFLNSGECPIVDGIKQTGCFSHPGSYLGEIGVKTISGDRIYIDSGDANDGFKNVTVNGQLMSPGDTIQLLSSTSSSTSLDHVMMVSTHTVKVVIGQWLITFTNSDHFMNQAVRVKRLSSLRSHGLFGQTWSKKTYPNAIKYIEGSVDEYAIGDHDLYGDDFVYNVFGPSAALSHIDGGGIDRQ